MTAPVIDADTILAWIAAQRHELECTIEDYEAGPKRNTVALALCRTALDELSDAEVAVLGFAGCEDELAGCSPPFDPDEARDRKMERADG